MNIFAKFLKKLDLFSKPKLSQDLRYINSAENFLAILKREIARADRYNKKISLIVFYVDGYNDGSFTQFFVNFLSSRVRLSDEVGWFDEKSIGVLLPDTALDGAWKIAREIREKTSHTILPPSCRVYMYPSTQWPSEIV